MNKEASYARTKTIFRSIVLFLKKCKKKHILVSISAKIQTEIIITIIITKAIHALQIKFLTTADPNIGI